MATYLRRVVVPEDHAPQLLNYIQDNVTRNVMTDNITINKKNYRIIRFVSSSPIIFRTGNISISRKGTAPTQKLLLERIAATDLDIQAALQIDTTDLAAVNVNTAGTYNVTMTVTDADGISSTLEFPVYITDITVPLITLTATAIDVTVAQVEAWDPATNIASAVDDGDDVSGSVVFAYKQTNAAGAVIASLADARIFLGTLANAVYVTYNYSDASANAAIEKTATFTAVA